MVDKPQPGNEYENIKGNINKCYCELSHLFAAHQTIIWTGKAAFRRSTVGTMA